MNIQKLCTTIRDEYQKLHPTLCSTRLAPSINNQLTVSNKRFKKLIEQAPDAFFSHDLQGNFLQVNEQTCQQLGYQRHEMLALNASNIQRGIEPEQAKKLWQKVRDEETVLAEDVLMRKDGSTFPAEIKIGLFKDGNKVEVFGFFRDITERKGLEEEREGLIDRLEKALAEVKVLRGIIPICSYCKKIRDDKGSWSQVEEYITKHTDAKFSHGICSECQKREYEKIGIQVEK